MQHTDIEILELVANVNKFYKVSYYKPFMGEEDHEPIWKNGKGPKIHYKKKPYDYEMRDLLGKPDFTEAEAKKFNASRNKSKNRYRN